MPQFSTIFLPVLLPHDSLLFLPFPSLPFPSRPFPCDPSLPPPHPQLLLSSSTQRGTREANDKRKCNGNNLRKACHPIPSYLSANQNKYFIINKSQPTNPIDQHQDGEKGETNSPLTTLNSSPGKHGTNLTLSPPPPPLPPPPGLAYSGW